MRQIEKQMNFAVSNKGNFNKANTQVSYNENTNCSQVYLHGHQIATYDHNTQALKMSSCGYETVTTKSRLNALLTELKTGCSVFQRKFIWYLCNDRKFVDFFDGMILLDTYSLEVA